MKKFLGILLLVILVFGFVGCGTSEKSAEQVVKNTLEAIKSDDMEKCSNIDYVGLIGAGAGDGSDEASEKIPKLILNNLEYKIMSSSISGNTAVVNTEITNIDMAQILSEYIQQAFALAFSNLDEEQLDAENMKIFTGLLSQSDNETVTIPVDVQLIKEGDVWKIELTDDFIDAVYGGMISSAEAMGNTLGDKLMEINNWIVGDIWNDGFCDIVSYISNGTSSTGESLDIDFTINQLKKFIEKKAEYDEYIESLEDSKHANIKNIWSKLSSETDLLYSQVIETRLSSETQFDTGKFQQYRDAFSDAISEID